MSVDASTLPGNKGSSALFTTPPPATPATANPQAVNGQNFIPRNAATGAADYSGTKTTPTAVASSNSAANHINTVVVPAMTAAQNNIAGQNTRIASSVDSNLQLLPGETGAQYTARVKAYQHPSTTAPTPTAPTPANPAAEAAAKIANTPDAGNQFAWNTQGGAIQVPLGSAPPTGYTLTQPAPNPVTSNTPMVNHFVDKQGNTFAQYNNGTYGQIDSNGNYVGTVTPQQFEDAQQNSPGAQLDQIKAQVASVTSSLTAIQNGSYPLTASQQAVINGLSTQLQQDVATQTQANANFTGATTVAQNLYGLGNSLIGIGAIKATVDAGVQKIMDLQTKSAGAVAQMVDSFNKDNMTMLKTAYDVYDNSAKEIQANIDKIADGIRQAKVDAQNQQHQNFQDFMTSQNYTLATKKQAFDQYIQQATLDENKKKDATDAWYKAQDIALRQQAGDPFANGSVAPVGTGANGAPSKSQQAAYLAQFTPIVQSQIKGLATYQTNPASFPTRVAKGQSGLNRSQAIAMAQQYDPTYDEKQYASRAAMQKNVTSGQYSQTITAANTLVQHLAELEKLKGQLSNSPLGVLNAPMNALAGAVGSPVPNNFNITRDAIASEAAKIYKGTGSPAEKEIADWKNSVNANSSPAQIQGAINTITTLMAGKLSTLSDNYSTVMGQPAGFQILTDRNANTLKAMGVDPGSVDPTYGNDPTTKVQTFYKSSPQNASAVDAIMKAAPDATPDEVMDQLNQAGIEL